MSLKLKLPILYICITTVLLLGIFNIVQAASAFNQQINYQGKLTNSSNVAVSDGGKCMRFSLYTVATEGTPIWTEEWKASSSYVVTTSGLFSVLLGSNTVLSSVNFNQSALYLQVDYDPDLGAGCPGTYLEVFSPRKQFGAVPAAFEAKQLAGATWEAPGTIGSTTPNTGAFTTLNTGQGAYELYAMDQNVLTTSSPTFAGLGLGSGNLTTTGSGRFDGGLGVGAAPDSSVGLTATLTASVTSSSGLGSYNTITASGTSSYGYGSNNYITASGNSSSGYGSYNTVYSSGASTNELLYGTYSYLSLHAAGVTAYGEYIISNNSTYNDPTVNQMGLYINWSIAGTDASNKRWAIYNASTNTTAGKVFLGLDNVKTYWGTGYDASIYWDATNLVIDSGIGAIDLLDNAITTSGTLGAGAITGTSLSAGSGTLTAGIGTLTSINLTADTNQIVLNSDGGVAAITLTGTAATSAKTITFPDITGTVALTTGVGGLSSYLPLAGGTMSGDILVSGTVNLGATGSRFTNIWGTTITGGSFTSSNAAGTLDFSGATSATISTSTAGIGLTLDAKDAAANSSMSYVTISGTTPAHASGTPTDIFLDINPTLGINTGAANTNLVDLTFTSPAWATAVASNLRALYIAPTIGNATTGTNAVNAIEIANITGDAQVNVTGLKIGTGTTLGTSYAIDIGSGWDLGINDASGITSSGAVNFTGGLTIATTNLTITDKDVVLGTTTGTKFGTATNQKLGFFNATPIIQPTSTTDLRTALINLGLYATGGATPLNLNGGAFTTTDVGTLGKLVVNTSDLVVNAAGYENRVGIGTATPSVALEVGSNTAGQAARISATLGSELAPALTTGNWTLGTGWQYLTTPNRLDKNADGTGTATPSAATTIVAGTTYKVIIIVDSISGSTATYTLGGSTGTALAAATTYTDYITAATTGKLIITPIATGLRITISSISIKALTTGTGDLFVEGNLKIGGIIHSSTGIDTIAISPSGNVGIGTTGPDSKLDVLDAANPQLRLTNTDGSIYTEFTVAASTGDLTVSLYPSTSANDITFNMPGGTTGANLWVCNGTACAATPPADGGNLILENALIFDNNFRMEQTAAATTTVYDSLNNEILIFDEVQ